MKYMKLFQVYSTSVTAREGMIATIPCMCTSCFELPRRSNPSRQR